MNLLLLPAAFAVVGLYAYGLVMFAPFLPKGKEGPKPEEVGAKTWKVGEL